MVGKRASARPTPYTNWGASRTCCVNGTSTATSYKKKKHSYITRRSEHHHHTNNARKQHTQQNTTPPQTGRGSERNRRELRRRHQRCATPKTAARCKPERHLELLHHGRSPSSHTHDRRSPCPRGASVEHPVAAPMKIANPSHSVWGPRLSHRLTSLPRTQVNETAMGATPPSSRHRGHQSTKRASSRPLAPMGPLHLPANTNQAHLHCRCARATPSTNHRHYLTKAGLRCDASKEGTTPMALPSHVQRWTGFSPSRASCSRGHGASQWCPQQGQRHHKGAATIATDKSVSEGFRPTQHHTCHTFLVKSVAPSSSPPHRLHRKKPGPV